MSKLKTVPWIGDLTAGYYDKIMEKSVFPRKFRADFKKHSRLLYEILTPLHSTEIIEIGTGSGITAEYLTAENRYTGIDISPRLLKRAEKRFTAKGFICAKDGNASFYRTSAEALPFNDALFDYGICLLTLNFIHDTHSFLRELKRVLRPAGTAFFCVPCHGLLRDETGIRGKIVSIKELELLFTQSGFSVNILDRNGALLYFEADKPAM